MSQKQAQGLLAETPLRDKLVFMDTLAQRILEEVQKRPGITDKWLAEALFGLGTPQQRVNGECRRMASRGLVSRNTRPDGLIGNYCTGEEVVPRSAPTSRSPASLATSEDQLKAVLRGWLEAKGWDVSVAWAKTKGIDIEARRGDTRWIIEVKGSGSRDAMRVNYFLHVLGETLQRMGDPTAIYSIALPDVKQFRNLWARLPILAKRRTNISALFVSEDGRVELLDTQGTSKVS